MTIGHDSTTKELDNVHYFMVNISQILYLTKN